MQSIGAHLNDMRTQLYSKPKIYVELRWCIIIGLTVIGGMPKDEYYRPAIR